MASEPVTERGGQTDERSGYEQLVFALMRLRLKYRLDEQDSQAGPQGLTQPSDCDCDRPGADAPRDS